MKNKKIVITGGAGFIGSNLALHLQKDNEVIVIDDLSTGREENLKEFTGKIVKGSILDLELLQETFKGVDYVLHQAAIPSVPRSIENPIKSNDAGVGGTLNVLVAARDNKVKRVVYASSSSIYGGSEVLPKVEDMNPDPKSPYAVSKMTAEFYCKVFYQIYGLETVALRYFNVFGPNQDPNSDYAAVIPKFIRLMLKNERPTIFGDGMHSRDFTYIENNIKANILACTASDVGGMVFNIACGKRFTLIQLVETINKILGTNIQPKFADPRPGDPKHSLADLSKAEKYLNYKVLVDFETGLKRTVEWIKSV